MIVWKPVSPSPGMLVWTSSTLGSASRIVSASVARSSTACDVGAGRRGDRDAEDLLGTGVDELRRQERDDQRASRRTARRTTPTTPSFVQRLRSANVIAGDVGADPERVLGLPVLVDVGLDPVDEQVRQDRHDRQRADQRREQREGHGEGEGQEELADEAADEAERQEHADRGDGRRGDGAGDLLRAVDRGSEAVFAHGAMSIDVLEDDDRVVDHASDGDGEAAEGEDVQRDAGDLHDHERREQRQRDADRRDERRAQAEQEEEDRQDREQGAQAAFAEQAVARLLDERSDRSDTTVTVTTSACWRAELRELGADGVRDLDRVGGRGLGDRQRQRRVAPSRGRVRA